MRVAPLIIAHRGASGYLPEHTLEGKALAYGQGADFLEQDVIATRDGELIVCHDLYLENISDVAQCVPARARSDGHFYAIDFDLQEIQALSVCERRKPGTGMPLFPQRYPNTGLRFRIPTLVEELQLVQGLNHSTGRKVGVYPEIKDPRWHHEHGIDVAASLLTILDTFGYSSEQDPVFVQCFDMDELQRVHRDLGSRLRLVQLVGAPEQENGGLDPQGLAKIAGYANGIGLPYSALLATPTTELEVGPLAAQVRAAGLALHPYTFRRDQLPADVSDLEQLLTFFYGRVGVDAVFCDHPDIAFRVGQRLAAKGG